MQGWADIPEEQRPFQRRLMEVFAGFLEHVDVQIERILDELDRLGAPTTPWSSTSSATTVPAPKASAAASVNCWPRTAFRPPSTTSSPPSTTLGGLDALGSPKTDNMYHAGWAWAGNTPFHHTKLVASHFGGTRNPMAISWPRRITPDG